VTQHVGSGMGSHARQSAGKVYRKLIREARDHRGQPTTSGCESSHPRRSLQAPATSTDFEHPRACGKQIFGGRIRKRSQAMGYFRRARRTAPRSSRTRADCLIQWDRPSSTGPTRRLRSAPEGSGEFRDRRVRVSRATAKSHTSDSLRRSGTMVFDAPGDRPPYAQMGHDGHDAFDWAGGVSSSNLQLWRVGRFGADDLVLDVGGWTRMTVR